MSPSRETIIARSDADDSLESAIYSCISVRAVSEDRAANVARSIVVALNKLLSLIPEEEEPLAPEQERLLSARELAELLGWTQDTVYRKARSRDIPCVRLGKRGTRFLASDVIKALKNKTEREGI